MMTRIALLLYTLLIIAASVSAQTKQCVMTLPQMAEWEQHEPSFAVGADACSDTIAPVMTPFVHSSAASKGEKSIMSLALPEIRKDTIVLRKTDTVAATLKGDSLASQNRQVIQTTIDQLSECGGGVVVIDEGEWLTGRIILKSGVNLHLSKGTTLVFSGEVRDYLPALFTRDEGTEVYSLGACIYANNAHDIALTGKGTIIGAGTDSEIYHKMQEKTGIYLPKTFAPIDCERVLVEGVTINHGIYWNIVPQYCRDVVIRGVTVNSFGHGRTDGIDIDSSERVLIEYCTMDCQDDCYCMKSGRGEEAVKKGRPTKDVVVRNCLALRGGGGIVCGTEMGGGIYNIYCHDCVFKGTDHAVRLKTRRPRGGHCSDIFVDNIFAKDLKYSTLKVDMLGNPQYLGQAAVRFPMPEVNGLTPSYRDIMISNIYVDGCQKFINVKGLPESPIKGVTIDNATVRCDIAGSMVDGEDFKFSNIQLFTQDPVLHVE